MTQVTPTEHDALPDEERVLRVVRPAMFRARPLLFSAHVLAIVGGVVAGIWVGFFTDYPWAGIGCAIVVLVALASLGWWWIQAMSTRLRITNVRTIQDHGFFSRHTSEVLHDDIRNVRISQSLWNRLWGVGRIEIGSAGHQGFEIGFNNIAHPYKVRQIIDEHRDLTEDERDD